MFESSDEFFQERRLTYHRFVVWSAVFLLHCIAIVGLLAIFRS